MAVRRAGGRESISGRRTVVRRSLKALGGREERAERMRVLGGLGEEALAFAAAEVEAEEVEVRGVEAFLLLAEEEEDDMAG